MRRKIIAGNWKMNNTVIDAVKFINEIKDEIDREDIDVVVCPNNLSVISVVNELEDTSIEVGVQNIHPEDKGAYTGETSLDMVIASGAEYAIVGHSERRAMFGETNEFVNKKVLKCLEKDITPIMCVGETLEERQSGKLFDIIKSQVTVGLNNVEDVTKVVIAYEPIWAIGTGVTATKEQAEEMCKYIRDLIKDLYSPEDSEETRIQYGGSVTKDNAKDILNMPNIDGALVGGASLKKDFIDIVNF